MRKTIITLLLSALALLPAAAQKGLAVDDLFGGRYRNRVDVVETLLRGKSLKGYGLTLFRSLAMPAAGRDALLVERKVCADVADAVEKEAGYKKGRLYYGFFRLKPRGKGAPQRFIFYRNNELRDDRKPELTLIYMEGTASMEELRRTFTK